VGTSEKKAMIVQKLKESGCRITKQRLILLDIILENEYSSCKEIYYKAQERKANVGIATVYRMLNTLEEAGFIRRKNIEVY
jgi:Fur family ferric uptake transcriptional regulator